MSMHWGLWLFWLALFLLLGWMVIGPARSGGGASPERPRESVEEALRRRFAEGEMDEDEFKHRLRIIRESRQGS